LLGKSYLVVGQDEIAPVFAKVQAISNFPAPCNANAIPWNYRKFCRNFSVVTELFTRLLQKCMPFVWSADCQAAFIKTKSLQLSVPVLIALDFDKPFKLMVDASDAGGGAVLFKRGRMVSITQRATFHTSLIGTRGTCEKETLALLLALQHLFRNSCGRSTSVHR